MLKTAYELLNCQCQLDTPLLKFAQSISKPAAQNGFVRYPGLTPARHPRFDPWRTPGCAARIRLQRQGGVAIGRVVIEWCCQKLPCQFHHCVDHKECEKALPLLTPDVDWWPKGFILVSCDEILGGSTAHSATVRYAMSSTNSLIDENLAIWRSHSTYCSS